MYRGDAAGLAHLVTAKATVPVIYEPVLAVQFLCVYVRALPSRHVRTVARSNGGMQNL
jgi:hypothetical protein